MSARLLRKVLKEQEESHHHLEEEEEEVEEAAPSKNPFLLLEDDDEVEEEEEKEALDVDDNKAKEQNPPISKKPLDASTRKSRKKKKKKKTTKNKSKPPEEDSLDSFLEDMSIDTKPSPSTGTDEGRRRNGSGGPSSTVLLVDPKFLKAENELRKIFGSKVVNSFENQGGGGGAGAGSSRTARGGRRAGHNPRRTILVTPSDFWARWDGTLSMELIETKDGIHYFRYVHSSAYDHAQQAFEAAKAINDLNAIGGILRHYPYHIDSLLTFAEVFKFSGEHQSSADAISKCLFALECAWHPLFTPLQGNCRLKYTHDTNKPLFTALFSHMKNMDRRGCHRSALEVCKLLLSLDSDDPKGALFCIDYFSLRAQEYAWLERFAEEYESDNSLWLFPNYSYSLAVCRFYLEHEATPQTEKSTSADLMKQALMLHPLVLQKLVDKAPLKDMAWTQILKNLLFGSAKPGSMTLDHLISIYVERNYLIWRFPELQNLMKEAAQQVIETMKKNSSEVRDWACIRKETFSSERNEYSHLLVSDFSDTVPSLPPEELQQFMVGPQMVHEMPADDIGAAPERARMLRDVAGRNPAVVFLESILPWIDYEDNGDDHPDDHDLNLD
ncbi:transcription factor 25 [Iris pallida]|uniref:Transcription factor 25 n=1 Tax=Iris pallida TaxID=29817 RepID=A0AAX6GZI2_IRIPA|nr:transcription factor 25 [Iris pallida]